MSNYAGYFIKLGGASGTIIPNSMIKMDTFKATPNQRMELYAYRDTSGGLHRATVGHTATKIEFNTKILYDTDQSTFMATVRSNWISEAERSISVQYYDEETDTYKVGTFYMPDIQWTVRNAYPSYIMYEPARVCFIEY